MRHGGKHLTARLVLLVAGLLVVSAATIGISIFGANSMASADMQNKATDTSNESSLKPTDATGASTNGSINIVLVHGAWADGSSWSQEIPILQKAGHKVIAVQLPLHSLADDVATVKRAIALVGGPTILVGHSYGGMVITNAAYNNKNVTGLVYIAAFAPAEGQSLGTFVDASKLPKDFLVVDNGGFAYINPAFFHDAFAQDISAKRAAVMAAVQKPLNLAIVGEKSGPPAWKQLPTWYQVSENDKIIPPDAERFFASQMNATTISIKSSHASLVSHPHDIAKLILDAAEAEKA